MNLRARPCPPLCLLASLVILPLVSCSLPRPAGAVNDRRGRFAVVITNQSDSLVNTLLSVVVDADSTLSWVVPVGPHSWDSLILDCNVDQVTPIGALVADPLGGSDSLEVGFDEPPFLSGLDFDCGSVIAIEIENSTRAIASRPISVRARTANRSTRSPETSGFPPAAETGFILLDAAAPAGVAVRLNFGWEDSRSRVFQSSLTLSGRERAFAALLTCPINRFTIGQLDDTSTAGATLINSDETLDAPPPLPEEPLSCGGTIEMRLIASPNNPTGYALTLGRVGSSAGESGVMYDDIRALLEDAGLGDRPSSLLTLLPPPVVDSGP